MGFAFGRNHHRQRDRKALKKVAEEESRKAEQAVKEVKEQAQATAPALPAKPAEQKGKEEEKGNEPKA